MSRWFLLVIASLIVASGTVRAQVGESRAEKVSSALTKSLSKIVEDAKNTEGDEPDLESDETPPSAVEIFRAILIQDRENAEREQDKMKKIRRSPTDAFLVSLCDTPEGVAVSLPIDLILRSPRDLRTALIFLSRSTGAPERSVHWNKFKESPEWKKRKRNDLDIQRYQRFLHTCHVTVQVESTYAEEGLLQLPAEIQSLARERFPKLRPRALTPLQMAYRNIFRLIAKPTDNILADLAEALKKYREEDGNPKGLENVLNSALAQRAKSQSDIFLQNEVVQYLLDRTESPRVFASQLVRLTDPVPYGSRISMLLRAEKAKRIVITDKVTLALTLHQAMRDVDPASSDENRGKWEDFKSSLKELYDSDLLRGEHLTYEDVVVAVDGNNTGVLNELKGLGVSMLLDLKYEANTNPPMARAFDDVNPEVAEYLLTILPSAHINDPTYRKRRTPVTLAVLKAIGRTSDATMWEFVMKHKKRFDFDAKDALGLAPIHYAAADCNAVMAEQLRRAGANIHAQTGDYDPEVAAGFINWKDEIVLKYPRGTSGVSMSPGTPAVALAKRCFERNIKNGSIYGMYLEALKPPSFPPVNQLFR